MSKQTRKVQKTTLRKDGEVMESILRSKGLLMKPNHLAKPLAMVSHIPFLHWIVAELNPRVFVELGTHVGNSYFSVCQTVEELGLTTVTYAVDTWKGDEHAGFYSESVYEYVNGINSHHYKSFSTLIRSTFDDAVKYFEDQSIDLLHIDGLHTYEAVMHDFQTWLGKLSKRSVVVMHDTNVRERDFGVWRCFSELAEKYPAFEFYHGHGFGVLLVGEHQISGALAALCNNEPECGELRNATREIFSHHGLLLELAGSVEALEFDSTGEQAHCEGGNFSEKGTLKAKLSRVEEQHRKDNEYYRNMMATLVQELDRTKAQHSADISFYRKKLEGLEIQEQLNLNTITELRNSLDSTVAQNQKLENQAGALERLVKRSEHVKRADLLAFNASWIASLKLQEKIKADEERHQRNCKAYTDWVEVVRQIVGNSNAQLQETLHVARSSMSWKLMRVIRRIGATLLRRESDGRFGFLKWLVSRLLPVKYDNRHSFDPMLSLQPVGLPAAPVFDLNLSDNEQNSSPVVEEVLIPKEVPQFSEPVVVLDGGRGSGKVDIIIPVKNSIQWVAECLYWVTTFSTGDYGKIILVDDGSTEECFAALLELANAKPDISVVKNVSPRGFAAACNTGSCFSDAEFLLFLNSDCLLPSRVIIQMLHCCSLDKAIGMVTALSNSAANLSLDMPENLSFMDINKILQFNVLERDFVEACTVVGHCLLVTRHCFSSVGGFDISWGLGYGEETDLQMRAARAGFRAVTALKAYVYHFGGGTFEAVSYREQLQKQNHSRFMRIWGDEYQKLVVRCLDSNPVHLAGAYLSAYIPQADWPEVQFILPSFSGTVGGILVIVDLCNHLIKNGLSAGIIILGDMSQDAFARFREALYFKPIHVRNTDELFKLGSRINPKVVVSTLFTTVNPGIRLAEIYNAKFVNFVQGYEFYFSNGVYYSDVRETYRNSPMFLTTSAWLARGIARHIDNPAIFRCPLGVNPYINYPLRSAELPLPISTTMTGKMDSKVRVVFVLRSSDDKGQWILNEVIERLLDFRDKLEITVVTAISGEKILHPRWFEQPGTNVVRLPLTRTQIADQFRRAQIFVDASLHEGFGLMPLEAMACGCAVVCSSSGGISDFVEHSYNGMLVEKVNRPDEYVEEIIALANDRERLEFLRKNARKVREEFGAQKCFDRYLRVFSAIVANNIVELDSLEWADPHQQDTRKYLDEDNRSEEEERDEVVDVAV